MIKVLFFASLRERLGTGVEEIPAAEAGATLAALRQRLRQRGGLWAEALGEDQTLLTAVNQEMVGPDTSIRAGDEVAFFPPVTGG